MLAGGVATFSTTTLPAGSDSLSCSYTGDTIYLPGNCNSVILTNSPPPDFSIAGSPVSFASGKSGTGNLQLASINSFAGAVSVTCSASLPATYTCTLLQQSANLTAGSTATLAYSLQPASSSRMTPLLPRDNATRVELAALFPFTLLSLAAFTRKHRNVRKTLLGLTLLAIVASFSSACGHSSSPSDAGTYPITFTATGTSQGSSTPITHTLTVNATIAP